MAADGTWKLDLKTPMGAQAVTLVLMTATATAPDAGHTRKVPSGGFEPPHTAPEARSASVAKDLVRG
jgi:hypothetical protein